MAIQFLEKDLEDIIYDTPAHILNERGLECYDYDHKIRQLSLGKYGIADIVTVKFAGRCLAITIYELKQNQINVGTFLQALGYVKGIQRILSAYNLKNHNVEIRIVLIGKTIDTEGNFCYLTDYDTYTSFYTYNVDIDGLHFRERRDFRITDYKMPPALFQLTRSIPLGALRNRQIWNTTDDLPF